MRKNFRWGYLTPPVLIGLAIICFLVAASLFFHSFLIRKAKEPVASQSPSPADASPAPHGTGETANPDSIGANWKTYTYKNMSFKYPTEWVVVFGSEVAGQPSGFDLRVQDKNATGYAPDGLNISTFNDRENISGNNGYILNPDRKFTKTDRGDGYIQFEINDTLIYASCAFYSNSKVQDTIKICNQILSTFQFLD